MSFDHTHYVPILLTKRGERRGVSDLALAAHNGLTPLFVVPPIDWDYENETPKKSLDEQLSSVAGDIFDCWGVDPAFVDLYFVDNASRMATGQHPIEFLIAAGNAAGDQLVPAVSMGRDADWRAAVAAAVARDGRGACVRLPLPEWPSATGLAAVNQLLADIGCSASDVDLVLDVGAEVVGSSGITAMAMRTEIAGLPFLNDWRSLTVASAGFPPPPLNYGKGISVIDRDDWLSYKSLVGGPALSRIPTFGDYGIATPDPRVDVDPKLMAISATFRYAIDDAWLFAKGDLFKGRAGLGQGGAAMHPVAAQLLAHPSFAGNGHCAGDEFLLNAAGGGSGGNAEGWRRAGTARHLTHVVSEVASLHASSAGP